MWSYSFEQLRSEFSCSPKRLVGLCGRFGYQLRQLKGSKARISSLRVNTLQQIILVSIKVWESKTMKRTVFRGPESGSFLYFSRSTYRRTGLLGQHLGSPVWWVKTLYYMISTEWNRSSFDHLRSTSNCLDLSWIRQSASFNPCRAPVYLTNSVQSPLILMVNSISNQHCFLRILHDKSRSFPMMYVA